MTGGVIVLLGLQGLCFAAWTVQMFRCLFKLRAQAVAHSGKVWPGPIITLRSFRAFVTAPEYQRDRRILAVLTGALLILSVVVALALGQMPR